VHVGWMSLPRRTSHPLPEERVFLSRTLNIANLIKETTTNRGNINDMADKTGFRHISSTSTDEQNLAQIREILFGEHSRNTADHLARIESRLREQDAALRELLDERVAKTMLTLQGQLETQRTQQQKALDGLDSALRVLLDQVGERLTLLDSDLQDASHRLGQSLAEQESALNRLQRDSAQRSQLADLLETLVHQLREPPVA